jgi:hypothetical protein
MATQNKSTKAKKIIISIIISISVIGLLFVIGTVALGATIIDNFLPNIALNRQAKTNFTYLKNKNAKKLIDQFSTDAKNNHDLESEFDTFFKNVDGNVVSYARENCTDREQYVDNYKTTKHEFYCAYYDVKTDTGTIYEELSYSFYKINDYHPSAVGINTLIIRDAHDNEFVVGLQGDDFDHIQQ